MANPSYKLTPYSDLTTEQKLLIHNMNATTDSGEKIPKNQYENTSFYVGDDGHIATGPEIDNYHNWLFENDSMKLFKEDFNTYMDKLRYHAGVTRGNNQTASDDETIQQQQNRFETSDIRKLWATKDLNNNYGGKAWGKVGGLIGAGVAGVGAMLTSPMWAPYAATYFLAPTAAGMAWDELSRAITGTTSTDVISNYLLKNYNWTPFWADTVGGLSNPGYWINFGGVGRYTRPLFNKLGVGLPEYGKLELSPYLLANINALMPKSKFLTKVIDPTKLWFTKNISSRFTPLGLGNNYYNFTYTPLGTMSMGGLGEVSGIKMTQTPVQSWSLEPRPGFLIKSLFTGSPLEKQLSKLGTISVKLLQAYIGRNDVPAIDKELIGWVLLNHSGDTHIDYNLLRKEVLELIPKYNIVPNESFLNYGIDRIGFLKTTDFRYASAPDEEVPFNGLRMKTFTFESPNINGNETHYDGNTLGHSRTYTTVDEPDILHVMESLSDWAQLKTPFKPRFHYKIDEDTKNTNVAFDDTGHYYYTLEGQGMPYSLFMDTSLPNEKFPFGIASEQFKQESLKVGTLVPYMQKSYLQRQLQENLMYAAQHGQTKMRYPTPETAAKIEGYHKVQIPTPEIQLVESELQLLAKIERRLQNTSLDIYRDRRLTQVLEKMQDLFERLTQLRLEAPRLYRKSEQTILKKYADFPKQFLKLFGKQSEVRTVTDAKGNTWYEVDVPQSYLDGTAEMLFKKGGKLINKPLNYKILKG